MNVLSIHSLSEPLILNVILILNSTHTHTHRGNLASSFTLYCGRKPENPLETHTDTGRTYKLYIERTLHCSAGIWTQEATMVPTVLLCFPRLLYLSSIFTKKWISTLRLFPPCRFFSWFHPDVLIVKSGLALWDFAITIDQSFVFTGHLYFVNIWHFYDP